MFSVIPPGTLGSFAVKLGNAGLSLGVVVVLARTLDAGQYGLYAFAFALTSILAIPSQVGLPTLLVREIARYRFQKRWDLVRGLLRFSTRTVLIISLFTSLVAGLVIIVAFRQTFDDGGSRMIAWALLLIPLVALGNVQGGALRGLHRTVVGQLPDQVIRPGIFIALLCCAAMAGMAGPANAMALHAGAALITVLVGASLLRRSLPLEVTAAEPRTETVAWRAAVLPLSLVAGTQVINSHADVVLLGFLAGNEEAGTFKVCAQLSVLVSFVLAAINMAVAPGFARLHAAGDRRGMQQLATRSARLSLLAAVPVAVLMIVLGRTILGGIFGESFAAGYIALVILCLGQLVNAGMGSVGWILNMTGFERRTARGVMIAAVVNVLLNLALIPSFGLEGAAIATASSLALWNLLLAREVKSTLGIDSVPWTAAERQVGHEPG